MPRPSLRAERTEEVLEACARCVARDGLAGATLEAIAREAGLARPLVRHHVGNRDDILGAFVERFFRDSDRSLDQLVASLPTRSAGRALVRDLFDPAHSDRQLVQVSMALVSGCASDPELAGRMGAWNRTFLERVAEVLAAEHPGADPDRLRSVAAGIVGIYFNVESLVSVDQDRRFREDSARAALLLLDSLGT